MWGRRVFAVRLGIGDFLNNNYDLNDMFILLNDKERAKSLRGYTRGEWNEMELG